VGVTVGGAVFSNGGGVVDCGTTGGVVELVDGDGDLSSCINRTAAGSASEPPPNSPTADNAQMLTPRKRTTAAAPAYMTRADGPAYRPIGPRTGLPLPSTQNRQPSGAGGQDGSGLHVFGGTQLRRGGIGQFGGTANRFKTTPSSSARPRPSLTVVDRPADHSHRRFRSLFRFHRLAMG
jgi:hypothetical protein